MVAHCWRRKTLRTPSRRTHRTSPLPIAHSHAGRTDAPVPSPAHCGGPTTAPAAAFAFVSPWPSNILRNPIAFYGDSPRQQLTSRFKGHISPNYFHHGLLDSGASFFPQRVGISETPKRKVTYQELPHPLLQAVRLFGLRENRDKHADRLDVCIRSCEHFKHDL